MADISIIRTENPSVDFSDYAGYEELKEWMKKKVFGNKILAEAYGIEPPNRILLHGPSGVGKSYFTRCVAGEFDMPHAHLSVSPLTSERLEYSAQLVWEVFEEIRERGPMVVCFDHIEAIAISRDLSSDIGRMKSLRQFLLELPKMSDTDSVVIGTTADLDSLDYAVLKPGRFSRQWYIEMPDESARREIISMNMENRKTAPSWDLDQATQDTKGRPPAVLEEICDEAAVIAMERYKSGGSHGITNEDFRKAEEEISA